jgi:hypothetical protein
VKMKHIFMFHHQNGGQNHNIKIDSKFYENVEVFRFLEMIVYNYIS